MRPVIIPLSLSQVYLIPCWEGYLQIDTGYDRDYAKYRHGLERKGIELCEVKYLLLTHHHDDHAGFLNELSRDTAITIIAHENARELLKKGVNDKSRGGGYINHFIKVVADIKMRFDPHWTLTFPPFTLRSEDILVMDNDNLLLRRLGVNGRILYTPGHCIDHLTVVLDSGEAFCGDAASSFLLWAGLRYCTLFMTDMQITYQSWQKMLDVGAKWIYPAHGKPFSADQLRQNMGLISNEQLVKFF
ncbi:MAG TPA: MBL fold metallo-hydrolase [Longilinea sp.]|nr:MBL fold metallo-hydrolase [Longilinea sp.]